MHSHNRALSPPISGLSSVEAWGRSGGRRGPGVRWAALSGDPADIAEIDRELGGLFPDDALLRRWLHLASERVAFQGLPARICWLGYGDRARAGIAINELARPG